MTGIELLAQINPEVALMLIRSIVEAGSVTPDVMADLIALGKQLAVSLR